MSLVPPTSPVGVAGTAPAATVGTLVDAPDSLKAVDPGTIVKGTVEGRDRQGNMIVRTDHGVVAMRTAANFRPGTTVTMEVRVAGDGQHVVVLAADRRAAPAQQPPTQQPLPQQPAQQPAQQPSQQPAQQTGQPGTQQPAAASGGTQPAPAPVQGSGQASTGAPVQSAPAQPAPTTPSAPQPAVSVASSPIIAASTQPPQPLQAGQTVQALLLQTLAGHASANPGANAGAAAIASAQQAATPPSGPPGGTAGGAAPASGAPAPATPAQAVSPQAPPPGTPPGTLQGTPSPASPAVASPTAPAPGAASPNNTVPTTGTPAPATPNPATPQAAAPQGTPSQTGVPQTGTPQTGTPQTGAPQAAGPAAPAAPASSAAPVAPAPSSAAPPTTSGQPVLPPSLTAPAASASMAAPPPGASTTQILQALPVGSQFAVTVNSVLPPAPQATPGQATTPTPGLQPLPAGGATLTATVVGSTAAGQPLLQTSFGLVTIPGAQGLPAGTGVTLGLSPTALGEAEAAARAALGLSSGTAAATGQPGGLSRAWPALNEAFLQLSQINPALAQTLLQTAIPQPGQQLAGALLFFMAALRGGDVRGWMGDQAARALSGRDGRSPLLSRLSDDMGQMVRSGTDSAGNEWRGFYIPLFDGRDLQQIRLFMRDPTEEGGGGKDGGAGHRFLIDLDLSKLGPLQLDGLARTERLDLIVRTHRALPRDIKAEIARLFEETAERVGLKGQVSFQATPHFPPLPFVERNEIIEIHSEIQA